jgi:hypothetical protein
VDDNPTFKKMIMHRHTISKRNSMNAGLGLVIFFLSSSLFLYAQNGQLKVSPGATVQVSNGYLVLYNTDLSTDGIFNASGGTLIIAGNTGSSINGSVSPLINKLFIDKTGSNKLTLNNNLQVAQAINFQND